MIIPAPIRDIPRYTSLSFPSYRYVPKYFPHPFRSENGHQHRCRIEKELQHLSRSQMLQIFWLHGCDLFAFRYFWEAHEFWEEVWKETAKPRKYEIQAAIKMSASILKRHMNHIDASQKLWNQSFQILQHTTEPYLKFWRAKAQRFHESGDWMELDIIDTDIYPQNQK